MPSKPSRSVGLRRSGSSTGRGRGRRAAQRLDQQRDPRVGADGGRAIADQRELGGGHGCHRFARVPITSNDHLWRVRSAFTDGPALPAHVRDRRPVRRRSRPPRGSSATRSRPCPSTSPCSRPTSARRCWSAARSRRPRRARGCSSTRSRSCSGSTPPAPTSRGWPPARRSGCGSVRRRWRSAFAADLVAPALAVTVRVGAREEIARAVAVGRARRGHRRRRRRGRRPAAAARDRRTRRLLHRGAARRRGAARPSALRGRCQLEVLVDARWIDAPGDLRAARPSSPRWPAPTGSAPRSPTKGPTSRGLLALVAAGHGLALLPERALDGVAALELVSPRLVHRTERLTYEITPPLGWGARPIEAAPRKRESSRHGRHRRSRPSAPPRAASPRAR